ncbi:hypothetical protein ASC95_23795 [Pelomonas sp. Root1217]|uniref:hypothetical protein n=1 Tax=Pelomonas sp. Root1217 TaxID=1736430 RepID=UPI00070EE9D0|nr:hypothetical protein [Pelomonas sp. Root1217]KQV47213.1 hypothetical protein ASC95_23795 [Pelomonas sp. Root1217]
MRTFWRAGSLAALFILSAGAACASEITKLGVMSVLGREVQIVIHAPTTGTRVDRNAKDTLKVGNDFENFVLRMTVDDARREGLGETLVLARPANGSMPWQRDGQAVLVTQPLLDAARAAKLSHLVLIQPARGEAKLQMERTVVGNGQLEGLGFYVDTTIDVELTESHRHSAGFVAPFAYFDIYLVEVATLDLQAEHRARVAVALANPDLAGGDVWASLSTQSKIETLQKMIRDEVGKAVRDWSKAAGPAAKVAR